MKASVILPVYNKAPYLQDCLDSVFAQSFTDFEVIAVDDASTDESLAILRSCADPRLRVIALDRNLGPGLAAQRAMDEARSDYLIRVDADDIQLPDRFARQLAYLDAHPAVIACGSAIQLIGDGDPVRRTPLSPEACAVELLFGVAIHQPTMVVRRSKLVERGIRYRPEWPRVGEDRLFQVDLTRAGKLANLAEVLVRYRQQGQGISQQTDARSDRSQLDVQVLREFRFPEPDDTDLSVHAWTKKRFERIPDAEGLHHYRTWLQRLGSWNAEHGPFDLAVLEARLRQAWDELLYHLPQFGWPVTGIYLRMGGHLDLGRVYYLLRTFTRSGGPQRWRHRAV